MALLNYTTKIAAAKTANEIVNILAKAGASQIMNEFDQGRPTGIFFSLNSTGMGAQSYRLPVNAAEVEKVMCSDSHIPRPLKTPEQAERVAWRILKDWVEAQLAIIQSRMVSTDEVFLPYMLNGEHTVYELYLNQQLALTAGES
jgi:hypothetical protein